MVSVAQYEQLMRAYVAGFRFGMGLSKDGWTDIKLCRFLAESEGFHRVLPAAVEEDPKERAIQNGRCYLIGFRGVLLALNMAGVKI